MSLISETGALESAAGLVGRAFMAAEVSGDPMYTAALTPQVMELIGRSLLRRGDSVFYLDTSAGLTLLPAQTHSIAGGPMPSGWVYDVTLAGPGELKTLRPVQAEGVLHFRYGCDIETALARQCASWSGAGNWGPDGGGDHLLDPGIGQASGRVFGHSEGWRRCHYRTAKGGR